MIALYQNRIITICAFLAVILAVLIMPFSAYAQFNPEINYQGKLTNGSGVAVPDGTYNMNFWLVPTSGGATSTAVWSEARTGGDQVQVTNGLFSVMLGEVSSLASVDFDQTLYLAVEIGGTGTPAWDGELLPRKILGAVPAAFVAQTAATADEASALGGVASSSFLRSDEADTMEASSAGTLLSLVQNGAGAIARFFSGVTEVFTILGNGNVGVGTSTPSSTFAVEGNSTFVGNATTTGAAYFGGNVGIGAAITSNNLTLGTTQLFSNDNAHIYFSNTNTYIGENSNTNKLELRGGGSNGSHTVFIDSVGAIGLGDSAPSTKLEVVGTSTSGYFALSSNSSLVGDIFSVNSVGNVGIGSSSPVSKLTVKQSAQTAAGGFRVEDSSSALGIDIYQGSSGLQYLTFGDSYRLGSNVSNSESGFINAGRALTLSTYDNASGGYINFDINGTEAMRVTNSGTVGIGTTTPLGRLQVYNASGHSLAYLTSNASSDAGVYFGDTAAASQGSILYSNANDSLSIRTNNGTRLTVDSSGNIGIGTSTPGSRLTVAGDFRATGAFRDSSNASGTAGMVLQTTGTGTQWVATSTLGFTSGSATFLGLTDTISSFTANRILYTSGSAVVDSADLTYDGTNLGLGGNNGISFGGTRLFSASTSGAISIGVNAGPTASNDDIIAIGREAAMNAGFTNNNIAIGRHAGRDLWGTFNTYIGSGAGATSTGDYNNIIGPGAGSQQTGSYNNMLGWNAGINNQGSNNNFIGYSAGSNQAGSYNNAFGENAGAVTSGNYNNFIGYEAGFYLNSTSSTIIGSESFSGGSPFIALNNTTLGYRTGYAAQTGADNNILIGYQAADNLTTGANNLVIGYDVDIASTTGSNQLNIGNLIFGTGLDGTGTTLSSGNVGIGTTTPGSKLTVAGSIAATGNIDIPITTGSSAGVLSVAGNRFIHGYTLDSTHGSNQFMGFQAGNFTLGSSTNQFLGIENVGIGRNSLAALTTGSSNTAVGMNTLVSNTTGSDNTAIGNAALSINTTGNNNTALGSVSLSANTTGYSNVALGSFAMGSNITGYENIAIGQAALTNSTSSIRNVAIGQQSMAANTTGGSNVAVGWQSMFTNTTGDQNASLGFSSLYSNTSGFGNVAIGHSALNANTTGGGNIALGWQAGDNITTGSNNIIIGHNVEAVSDSVSNRLNIGNLIFGTGVDGEGTTLSSGNVGIGTTTPGSKLTVAGDFRATGAFRDSANASGTAGMVLQTTGTSTRWVATSSLGFSTGVTTFLGLTDTISSFTANRVLYTSGSAVVDSANLVFDGTNLGVGTTTPNNRIQVLGLINFNDSEFRTQLGYQAGQNLVAGAQYNTFVGYRSGFSSSTGSTNAADDNTGIGYQTLFANTTGTDNTAVGSNALTANTTGLNNSAVGTYALSTNTTGSYNSANGSFALRFNTTGARNTANGYFSLYSNNTGSFNTADGNEAMRNNTTGAENVAVGSQSLFSNTTGSFNTAIGTFAGRDINTATSTGYNTLIGYNTGRGITTGVNNTIIGSQVTGLSSSLSNNIIIADGQGNRRINVDSSGNVGIGTTTPTSRLSVVGDFYLTGALRDGVNASGTAGMVLQSTGTSTRWVATSSLGFTSGATTFLGLTDTPSSFTANRIMYTNSGATALIDSADFTYDGTNLGLGSGVGLAIGGVRILTASTTLANYHLGENSGNGSITGTSNVTIGTGSGLSLSSGNSNTLIGSNAGLRLESGSTNVAVGGLSLFNNVSGIENVAVGGLAGFNSLGSENSFIGVSSGSALVNGDGNLFAGYQAGQNIATTSGSVMIGPLAGKGTAGYEAYRVTLLGGGAGYNMQSGSDNNILIGYQAADNLTTGANNLVIGYDIDVPSATGDNQLNIGNLIFGTGVDGTGTTISSGNIGIGTTTPGSKLTVAGDLYLTGAFRDSVSNSAGTAGMILQTTGTSTRWVATSSLGIGGGSSLFTDGGATTYLTATGDNLAIGTTTASNRLTVDGSMNVTGNIDVPLTTGSSVGGITVAGNRFIHSYTLDNTYGSNQFMGFQAGNFTLGSSTNQFAGIDNLGIGAYTLGSLTFGSNNTAVGQNSSPAITTGSGNTSMGAYSLFSNTTGNDNVAIGQQALTDNTSGIRNTAVGSFGLANNETGENNSGLGFRAGHGITTGSQNTAIGSESLYTNSTGSSNTALGYFALNGATADNNTAIGAFAGQDVTSGTNNTIIGNYTGVGITTGSHNTIIGAKRNWTIFIAIK
jgi:trimeric autotransporter adhesin